MLNATHTIKATEFKKVAITFAAHRLCGIMQSVFIGLFTVFVV